MLHCTLFSLHGLRSERGYSAFQCDIRTDVFRVCATFSRCYVVFHVPFMLGCTTYICFDFSYLLSVLAIGDTVCTKHFGIVGEYLKSRSNTWKRMKKSRSANESFSRKLVYLLCECSFLRNYIYCRMIISLSVNNLHGACLSTIFSFWVIFRYNYLPHIY